MSSTTGNDELTVDAAAEEYAGPAVVSAGSTTQDEIAVDVRLRGHFEPLDGRFHWYGRISATEELDERVQSGATVTVTTPHGSAEGRLSDLDPWGRFRITGTGRPPF
jgi:hypothetical protein